MANNERQTARSEQLKREMYQPSAEGGQRERVQSQQEMTAARERLQAKESVAEALKQSAFEKVPAAAKYFEGDEFEQVQDLVERFEALSAEKQSAKLSAEDYAVSKREIFTSMNLILDKALDRIQDEAEASEAEEVSVQEDADTAFVKDMSAVEARRAEQSAQEVIEAGEEDTVESDEAVEQSDQDREIAEAWDKDVGKWITWAVEARLYNPDTDNADQVWRGDLSNQQLLEATGLDQQQLFQLTSAMIRRKRSVVGPGQEQAA